MPARKVCILSPAEARDFQDLGIRPDCRNHMHEPHKVALLLAGERYGSERQFDKGKRLSWPEQRFAAYWLGDNYLVIEHLASPCVVRSHGMSGVQWRTDRATTAKRRGRTKLFNRDHTRNGAVTHRETPEVLSE